MLDAPEKIIVGQCAEAHASRFLQAKGLQLLERNYRCKCGEIDLIMRDNNDIVFVEVRTRNHPDFGDAIESVTPHKRKKIIKTATFYLCQKRWMDKVNCRFDVIGISDIHSNITVDWIKDAFFTHHF